VDVFSIRTLLEASGVGLYSNLRTRLISFADTHIFVATEQARYGVAATSHYHDSLNINRHSKGNACSGGARALGIVT
jgi:hypothetical protein